MKNNPLILSIFFLIMGFFGGLVTSHLTESLTVFKTKRELAGQSDTQPGQIMRGKIHLSGKRWLNAHFLSRDCNPSQNFQISTHKGYLYYMCVKR